MRAVRIAIVPVVAAGAGVFAWRRLHGDPCRRFADRVCAAVPGTCGDAKFVFDGGGVSADRCREGNRLLDAAETKPPGLRVPLTTAAFAETIGAEEILRAQQDASMLLMDIDFSVDQGHAPDDLIKRLKALGTPACSALVGRLGANDPKRKELAHQVLVELRGQDLGADAAAWQGWCRESFRASLKR